MRSAILLGLAAAPALWAQFDLFLLKGAAEFPAPQVVDYGATYPGEAAVLRFRLRNTSDRPAAVTVLSVDGPGFSLSSAPALPASLELNGALEFAVAFQTVSLGSYSAALRSNGVSVLLTGAVLPSLTPEIDLDDVRRPLGPISFEPVERGSSSARHIVLENLTAQLLSVPLIASQGAAFSLAGAPPAGTLVLPRQSARFEVLFDPPAAGTYTGTLFIGDRTYVLSGSSFDPALPQPVLSIDGGTAAVRFELPARTSGSGILTLDFQPLFAGATDPAIAFASGTRTLDFPFVVGDQSPLATAFEIGTTAGTITLTATLGSATASQSLIIPPAPIAIVSTGGVRTPSSLEIRVTAIDNTRTAGPIVYSFFDSNGSTLATIPLDAGADFARYFQTSGAGGNFQLRSTFPITGDAGRIASYDISLTNSAGTIRTTRTPF